MWSNRPRLRHKPGWGRVFEVLPILHAVVQLTRDVVHRQCCPIVACGGLGGGRSHILKTRRQYMLVLRGLGRSRHLLAVAASRPLELRAGPPEARIDELDQALLACVITNITTDARCVYWSLGGLIQPVNRFVWFVARLDNSQAICNQ